LQAPRGHENQWRVVSTSVSDFVVLNAVVIVAASRPRKLEKVGGGVAEEPTKLVAGTTEAALSSRWCSCGAVSLSWSVATREQQNRQAGQRQEQSLRDDDH
jgi:hypothetical protein